LIDEVHMLSQHSFNALLKTLEEPPAHVKFILATTDPQKLPVTVLSRCLQFNLKHLPADLISKHLQLILKDEELNYEVQALDILAQAAHGSMRDALSLLDQAITSCNEQLLASDVKSILGYTQQDYAVKLLDALAKQNGPAMLTLSQHIAIEGGHFQYVIDELLNYLHQIAVYQSIGDMNPLINPTDEIKNLATQFSNEDIQLFYQIGLKGREEIHLAPTLAIGFNMTLLRMLTFRPAPAATIPPLAIQQNNVIAQPAMAIQVQQTVAVESIKESASPLIENTPSTVNTSELITEPSVEIKQTEIKQTIPIEAQNWASIIPELKLTGFALNAIENAEFIDKDGRDITLRVAKGHESLFTPTTTSRIEAALTDYYQSPVKIILNSKEAVQATPAQQKERATQQKQQKAEAALHNDPLFQQIQQEFSAELVKNSIVPLKDDL
jgi:DNA polymerase-3 subunit gamma/tau